MKLPLDVQGRLLLQVSDGPPLRVEGEGDVLHVSVARATEGWRLWRCLPRRRARTAVLRRLHRGLGTSDLELRFSVAGRVIARLDGRVKSNLSARVLGLAPMELRPMALLAACVSRQLPSDTS